VVGWVTTWIWGLGFIFLVLAGIWVFIDFIMIIFGVMKDGKGNPIKKW
jgi:hypothetical protein